MDIEINSPQRSPVRVNPILIHPKECRQSLDGEWRFCLDPTDEGLAGKWSRKPEVFQRSIRVPGCWQGQGFGHEGPDEIWDFKVKAKVYQATYKGTGWYAKSFSVPKMWKGKRIWLNFGGVHPSADVYLNGEFLGTHSGPFVPFGCDITNKVKWDDKNFLVVRVHERNRWMGYTFGFWGNWSGFYRSVELTATGPQWIQECRILPDIKKEKLVLVFRVCSLSVKAPVTVNVSVTTRQSKPISSATRKIQAGDYEKAVSLEVPVVSPKLWSPDTPNLSHVHVILEGEHGVLDAISERIGFVTLSTRGKHFLINGEPYFMRGTADFAIHPETGGPDTDRERLRRKLQALREYGYNWVRLQSYAETPEYYDVADEVGLLIQNEMGMLGAYSGTKEGLPDSWPQPSPEFYPALKWHWEKTVLRDVNHPSANLYCMSNELALGTSYHDIAWECYHSTKTIKPSALLTWTDGSWKNPISAPILPADFANAEAEKDALCPVPLIQHEFRWWTSYPNVSAKHKYTGAVLPAAIELLEKAAEKSGLSHLLSKMTGNSMRLQYVEAKGKLEACRRDHPTLAGISHFSGIDSGFAFEGILDDFYDKKIIDSRVWLRTNGDTVLLLSRNFDERVLTSGETFRAELFVSDFSHPPFRKPIVEWNWGNGRRVLAKGKVSFGHQPFRTSLIGEIRFELPEVERSMATTLSATMRGGRREVTHQWYFWVFPSPYQVPIPDGVAAYPAFNDKWMYWFPQPIPIVTAKDLISRFPKVLMTGVLDEEVINYIRNGGRVLLVPYSSVQSLPLRPFEPILNLTVGRYFFTRPANYPPHDSGNSGTIITSHPMLGDFPHEGFADLQFYRLIAEAPPLDLEAFAPVKPEPVIRSLGSYVTCPSLGYLVEFKMGNGGVVFCALQNLHTAYAEGHYLLATILRYMVGESFSPKVDLPVSVLRKFITT